MILSGPAATARIAREDGLALHALHFDPDERSLVLEADGTRVDDEEQKPDTGLPELDAVLGKTRAIVVRPGCRRYRITFEQVITYAVHDESYHVPETDETKQASGAESPLRQYSESRFLSYLAGALFVDQVMETAPLHYCLACLDDVIDVASYDPPEITSRVLTASDLWLHSL